MEKKERKKILILENDDFLREILGNLLHKKGFYIISEHRIEKGLDESHKQNIDLVILGTSCFEYKGKETLSLIRKKLGKPNLPFFIINETNSVLSFVKKDEQIVNKELSIQRIISRVEEILHTQ